MTREGLELITDIRDFTSLFYVIFIRETSRRFYEDHENIKLPWVPEVIFFFLRAKRASNAAKPRQRGAKRREKISPSHLPSEPAKRLIFSPTMRQRASGTRVTSNATSIQLS